METEIVKSALSLTSPEDISNFATTLKTFIEKNKLSILVKGNKYVLCDGWKFAGLNFGLTAIPNEPIDKSKENEIKYSCGVDLVQISTGIKLGYGFAICSNKESMKKSFDEYAIASMAQTRGIAKAYRNLIGFIMMAAGYADTPAEEVIEPAIQEVIKQKQNGEVSEEVSMEIQRIGDLEALKKYWETNTDLHNNSAFNALVHKRKLALVKLVKPIKQ